MNVDSKQIAREAAEWIVRLSTQDITPDQLLQLQQWQQQSPEHFQAFERLQHLISNLQILKEQDIQSDHPVIQNTIIRKKHGTSAYISTLVLVCFMGWILYLLPWQEWQADVRNPAVVWQERRLSDSSQVKVAGKTSFNIKFDSHSRTIELLQGNILVDVAPDAERPFVVDVGHARIQALGTRFIVRHYGDHTFVSMLESKTEITAERQPSFVLKTGESLILDSHRQLMVKHIIPATLEQAWASKKLVVDNMALDQVLNILQSYQKGYYFYDEQAFKALKVTAVLPLDQPEIALQILSEHLNLNISTYTPFVTRIEKKQK